MASRLEEDETQGQSKWADLDDDDDDWAPEAITWTDGTKTTLPHPDEVPPQPAPVPELPKESAPEKSRSPALSTSTNSPLTKPAGLASGRGLKLKSTPQEKPMLVAKPPQQQPAKSPWATLPPVDKASPAAMEPPHRGMRAPAILSQKGMGSGASLPPPPKEFAPDDFSRGTSTWRDGGAHGGRELYNSQSGRHEPVVDRRGSFRSDQIRQPHLLQRSSQQDQPEPSSAFQTHRTSQDGHFGRRRASSNVSGGSGAYYRSIKGHDGQMPPPDQLGVRRPSMAGSVESAGSPSAAPAMMHGQPRYQHNQPGWGGPPHVSPQAHFATPGQQGPPGDNMGPPPAAAAQAPAQPGPDEVEYQKKLMRERNEIARKRRHDQEAAEEAARRERIQKKLDSMGPAPKKKSDKADTPTAEAARPTHIKQRDEPDTSPRTLQESIHIEEAKEPGTQEAKPGMETSPAARKSSQDAKQQPEMWTGSGPRPERFTGSWVAPAAQPPIRNVWGSPNNDRGLGNGTFNPDLVRVPGSTTSPSQPAKGPSPIAPPASARAPAQDQPARPQAPIGSRPSRVGPQQSSDLASKWVNDVHANDKKMSAARLSERMERERQLAERGMTIEDVQPAIKDTWRPVNVPGDGTRRQMEQDAPVAPHAGVIGSGMPPGQGTPSQSRSSRFFPSKDVRMDSHSLPEPSRPQSPTPPPPTMEDHPAYEGNVAHPHVSLPRPHPVVKLPPAARPNGGLAAPAPRSASQTHTTARRASEVSQEHWQQRFNNLLNPNPKFSPPKAMGVDPASRNAMDDAIHRDAATVSLPGRVHVAVIDVVKEPTSKPMAEECFDEPEIGSLPQVRVPHKAPEALWHPAGHQTKPLPKRFLVHSLAVEPFQFSTEAANNGSVVYIHFPGMGSAKTISLPLTGGRGGRGSRGGGRSRGHRGSSRRETSRSREPKESSSHSGRGNGRGSYRGRGSDNWNRSGAAPPAVQT